MGRYCDAFLPYSDESWREPRGRFSTIGLFTSNQTKKVADLWGEVRSMWRDVSERLKKGLLHFDFMAVSGDDAFWIIENLRSYLADISPENSEYFGLLNYFRGWKDKPYVDGAQVGRAYRAGTTEFPRSRLVNWPTSSW